MKKLYQKPHLDEFTDDPLVMTMVTGLSGDIDLDAGDGPLADNDE